MAVVLVWRPWGLFGKPQASCARRGRSRGAAAAAAGRLAPRRLGGARRARVRRGRWMRRALSRRPHDRHADRRAVRRQPALPDGPVGHAFVRARRLLRPRRLRRGAVASRRSAGRWKPRCCSRRCWRRRRVRLRLVLRAPLGRLPGDADAGLRADRLVGRVPVGCGHRRQQRPGRHLAGAVARAQARLLPAGARLHGGRLRPARAHAARAVRPGLARRAATRRCAPRRSAFACRACSGPPSSLPARSPGSPGRCSPSPRERSRRRRSASASRSTAW